VSEERSGVSEKRFLGPMGVHSSTPEGRLPSETKIIGRLLRMNRLHAGWMRSRTPHFLNMSAQTNQPWIQALRRSTGRSVVAGTLGMQCIRAWRRLDVHAARAIAATLMILKATLMPAGSRIAWHLSRCV